MGAPYSITATSHDHRNLALSMTRASTTSEYRYDESGQRFAKKEGMSNGEHYVLDGAATVGVFSDSGTLDYWNITLGGMVLGRVDATGDRFYYEKDHLGTVRRVLDESGSTTEWYDYDPWGALMRSGTVGTKDGYTGKERDSETGLDYFGARYYMPAFARWTTTDPLADDFPAWSPYNFVMGNPVTNIDSDGQEVRCQTEKECQQASEDIQELYAGAPVSVERRTRRRARFSIFGFEFGGEVTEEYFTVTVDGESDFDWSQDEYASALYDALASEDVVFNVAYQEAGPVGKLSNVDYQRAGGGYFEPVSNREANVYIDPRGYQRVGDTSSIILMHEMIGHGHPVATPVGGRNNAHDINRFYHQKLGITPRAGYRSPHRGYKGEIVWPRIGLYRQ